ncbi:Protein NDRG3, partial [Nibea albiflora]
ERLNACFVATAKHLSLIKEPHCDRDLSCSEESSMLYASLQVITVTTLPTQEDVKS